MSVVGELEINIKIQTKREQENLSQDENFRSTEEPIS